MKLIMLLIMKDKNNGNHDNDNQDIKTNDHTNNNDYIRTCISLTTR